VYPSHSLANALAFDYHCYPRQDFLAPAGPLARTLPAPDHHVYSAVVSSMLGLPPMQGNGLDDRVSPAITLRLTGPDANEETAHRGGTNNGRVIDQRGASEVTITLNAPIHHMGHATAQLATRLHHFGARGAGSPAAGRTHHHLDRPEVIAVDFDDNPTDAEYRGQVRNFAVRTYCVASR
jgi:hypothetical protein